MRLLEVTVRVGDLTLRVSPDDSGRHSGNVLLDVEGDVGTVMISGDENDRNEVATFLTELGHPQPGDSDLTKLVGLCRAAAGGELS